MLNVDAHRQKTFEYETKTGDKLKVNLESIQKNSITSEEKDGVISGNFSFLSIQRFSFSIDGRLDENDKKEIAQKFTELRLIIEEFFAQDTKLIQNKASEKIANSLQNNDKNIQDYSKKMLVDTFESVLKQTNKNNQISDVKFKSLQEFLDDILYKLNQKTKIYG